MYDVRASFSYEYFSWKFDRFFNDCCDAAALKSNASLTINQDGRGIKHLNLRY